MINDIALRDSVIGSKKGDSAAFTQLVDMLSSTVHSLALAITKDLHHSHDVSQMVFIKVWQKIGMLKNDESILPWIRQLTRYTAFNYIRQQKSANKHQTTVDDIDALLDTICDGSHHADSQLIYQQQNQLISHLLEQLPDESREIVVLYYREDHNSKTVADLLGLTESTVRKRLQRVREQLKTEVLSKYGRIILSTAPVGISAAIASAALTSSPVAAATLTTSAVGSQSHWLIKLLSSLGGALIGGLIAVLINNWTTQKALNVVDNDADIQTLTRKKNITNIGLIGASILMSLSYMFSHGWLFPVLSYVLFLVVLFGFSRNMLLITQASLSRLAETDGAARKKMARDKFFCVIGLVVGFIGGTSGLLIGLYRSGRFSQLW